MGRARLALIDGNPALALEECRRAAGFFQNREFPWAIVQLWEFLAETAAVAGRPELADEARATARGQITNS